MLQMRQANKSQILTIPIRNTELRIVSPFGFDSVIWKEGKYELELQYSGAISNTGFTILDDGSIAIPYWVKDVAKLWIGNQAPDREYAKSLQYLINEEIIINSEISDEHENTRVVQNYNCMVGRQSNSRCRIWRVSTVFD